jgi:ligand-binding SRPBCC domain-containing protein
MVEIVPHPHERGAYLLATELIVPRGQTEVFDFFGDAQNLEAITPPWLHFHVLTPQPIAMHAGTLIDYRLRLHAVPIRWRTKITAWEPSERFVDEQLVGPYRFWRHEHTFREVAGGTLVRDQVDYAVPGGALIHWAIVRRDVRRIFQYRHETLKRYFAENETAIIPSASRAASAS